MADEKDVAAEIATKLTNAIASLMHEIRGRGTYQYVDWRLVQDDERIRSDRADLHVAIQEAVETILAEASGGRATGAPRPEPRYDEVYERGMEELFATGDEAETHPGSCREVPQRQCSRRCSPPGTRAT